MKEKNSRQSFLGDDFLNQLPHIQVGIIGLGGGGSVIASSLAHVGFLNYFICDPDNFEESNLNRLLGARFTDIKEETPKVDIITRVIKSIEPEAKIKKEQKVWQECIEIDEFKKCKILFSGLDDFANRVQLEAFARKNKIILIDVGLTIKKASDGLFYSMGQVVMSHPNGPCFKCLGFITDEDLEAEATRYGDVGERPQVIWANSMLANVAVGHAIDLLSGWTSNNSTAFYKHLDGNKLSMFDNFKLESGYYDNKKCDHFSY